MNNDKPRRSAARAVDTEAQTGGNRRHRPDHWILILTVLLMVVGLVVVYSISPGLAASQHISQSYFITKQLIAVALGVSTFMIAAMVPFKFWTHLTKPLLIAALLISLLVVFTPEDAVYQAHRWLRLGGFSFQVAELVKFALLFWIAGFLTRQWQRGKLADFKSTLQPLIILLLIIGVIVAKLQSDLGSAGVMVAMVTLMAFNAGVPLKRIAMFGGLILLFLVLAISTSSYRRERLSTFMHPESDCLGKGYQACQALISVGSGGLTGLGLGYSVQAYGYTPEASDDSIFAIMAEEGGFIGTVLIILIYAVFIARLKRLIEHSNDQYMRLIIVGVLAWLSTQMVINIGAMLGLLPLKGITLPLISQGGTSLVFLTAALGIVFQISRYTSYNVTEPKTNAIDYSADRRGLRRSYNPALTARPRT
jgi:cell division protein FtsW